MGFTVSDWLSGRKTEIERKYHSSETAFSAVGTRLSPVFNLCCACAEQGHYLSELSLCPRRLILCWLELYSNSALFHHHSWCISLPFVFDSLCWDRSWVKLGIEIWAHSRCQWQRWFGGEKQQMAAEMHLAGGVGPVRRESLFLLWMSLSTAPGFWAFFLCCYLVLVPSLNLC